MKECMIYIPDEYRTALLASVSIHGYLLLEFVDTIHSRMQFLFLQHNNNVASTARR